MSNIVYIYSEGGDVLYRVMPDDSSYRYREIKGDDEVQLVLTTATTMHLPLGCFVAYDGIRYSLEEPPYIKKNGTRQFEYTCIFSAPVSMLKRYIFRNTVDGRLKFNLTAKPHEHLQMLIDNMNLRVSGWTAGACVEDVEKLVTYDYTTCWDALEQIAAAFDTEWEVKDKEISLKKVEYLADNPLHLSYGRGNGLLPGVTRDNRDGEESGLEILYAIGGDRNVVPAKNTGGEKRGNPLIPGVAPIVVNPNFKEPVPMPSASASPVRTVAASVPVQSAVAFPSASGSVAATNADGVAIGNKTLILPRSQELEYGGEVYCTDAQGYYVYKKNKPFTSRKEGALDCSDIYPSRVGTISEVIAADASKNWYDFKDATIPADLDFSACLLEGEKMTVIFQDGMLAGKEFDVNYKHEERRFEIVPQDIDGVTMPDDVFKPVVGGKYAVFGISLPDAYVCDNETQTGASWDMFRKAAAYLHDHSERLYTFGGKLDGIWAKQNWDAIKKHIVLGGMIDFQDNQLQADGVRVRITSIKQSLYDPESPEITMSNETIGQRLLGRIEQAEAQPVLIDESAKAGRQFTKRSFRDAKETMQMLEGALESFKGEFTEGISPITINTMQLLVGSEQCQFEFVSGNGSDTVVEHEAYYDKADGKFHCAAGWVRYMNGTTMAASASWSYANVAAFTSEELDENTPYYIYIRVSDGNGTFLESTTPFDLSAGSIRYLLLGILDSEQFGNRSWCPMYGYTEITPGRIRVNKIISTDGETYFDLANNEIVGRINFKDGLMSGLIGAASSTGEINAGMNGGESGDHAVRFWAGATAENRGNAPFRVYDNGDAVMNNALIGGDSVFGGLLKQNVITIDGMQVTGDTNGKLIFYSPIGGDKPVLDWSKIFGFRTTVIVNSLPDFDFDSDMFGLMSSGVVFPNYFHGNLNDYVGNRIRIINKSNKEIDLGGCTLDELGDYADTITTKINPGKEAELEFVINVLKPSNKKIMAWYIHYKGPIMNTEN